MEVHLFCQINIRHFSPLIFIYLRPYSSRVSIGIVHSRRHGSIVTLNPLPGYEAIFIIKKNRGRTFTAHPLPTKVEYSYSRLIICPTTYLMHLVVDLDYSLWDWPVLVLAFCERKCDVSLLIRMPYLVNEFMRLCAT